MNFSGISLRDLEYIVSIADRGSFGKAAAQCGVSQPALSSQVRKVESFVGINIFERTTRRILITSSGQDFIRQARRVLEEASILTNMAVRSEQPFGHELKLAAISTLGPYLFPRIIGALRQAYPDTTLLLSEGLTKDLTEMLLAGELDAVLLSLPVAGALEHTDIFTEPFYLACPNGHPAGHADGPGWEDLGAGERLVLSEGHCLRDQALDTCSFIDPGRRQATSIETLKYMVAAGEGCTLLPALSLNRTAPVTWRAMPGTAYSRRVALVWRQTDPRKTEFLSLGQTIAAIAKEAEDAA